MKFDHVLLTKKSLFKPSVKKSHFIFEIKPLFFLNFNIQNVLHLKSNFEFSIDPSFFENSKKNIIIVLFLVFVFCFSFFFVYVTFVEGVSVPLNNSFLRVIFTPTTITTNKYFSIPNSFFNNLLIDVIHEFELV